MSKIFWAFLLGFTFFFPSFAEIDVPLCSEGETDPATSQICGTNGISAYGYSDVWRVTIVQNGSAKYMAVNGKWPPPMVDIQIHQRIRIKLVNDIAGSEAVTLHFHGILQEPCPVRPGKSFTYDFPVNQAGTYWIHSHATGQYPKGLRSPLIVRDSSEPAAFGYLANRDYLVTVSDWYRDFWSSEEVYQGNTCGGGVEPGPTRVMINDDASEWGHMLTDADKSYLLGPTETARFRFVNMAAFARFYIHFSDFREFTVVEIDGILLKGTLTKGIEIASGQRVSIVVTGPSPSNLNSARLVIISDPRIGSGGNGADGCALTPTTVSGAEVQELQVAWAWIDSVDPSIATSDTYGRPYYYSRPKVEFTIQKRTYPAPDNGEYWIPDYVWNFADVSFKAKDGQRAWMVDTSKPLENSIHTIMLVNDTYGHGPMGHGTAQRNYPTTQSQRGDHPIHIHGHHFQILAKIPVDTNPGTGNPYNFNYNMLPSGFYQFIYNMVTAFDSGRTGTKAVSRRDTLMIEKGWDDVIALKADNPVVWAMHCHNDFHASTGMIMQIVEQPMQLRNLLGTWYLGSNDNRNKCTQPDGRTSYMPVYSLFGSITQRYWNMYGVTNKLWGQFAQAIMGSFEYYGVPETCFGLV
ncbi:multicopper oxidase [Cadophora sp. DSE1049]|nr:multicopper oxidase [Cadophora sp. DSE1049]